MKIFLITSLLLLSAIGKAENPGIIVLEAFLNDSVTYKHLDCENIAIVYEAKLYIYDQQKAELVEIMNANETFYTVGTVKKIRFKKGEATVRIRFKGDEVKNVNVKLLEGSNGWIVDSRSIISKTNTPKHLPHLTYYYSN